MARNVTLGELIDDLRAEAGYSLQANLGTSNRDILIKALQRQQRRLWEDFDWPFLRIKRNILVAAGQRYYDLPDDMTLESVNRVEFKWGNRWDKLGFGIDDALMQQFDSDRDIRGWPLRHWQAYENDQIELWPIPSNNADASTLEGAVRFIGKRNLRPLVAESDRADLDDTLLVLFSAAEILAREKSDDAGVKLKAAEAHYKRLKGRNAKHETFTLSEEPQGRYPRMPKIIAVQKV